MCAAHNESEPMKPPPLDRAAALFLDVDGTLLEIAPQPTLVKVPPHLPVLLARLGEARGGALALVSGRALADLDRLFRPWQGAVAGLHGAERRRTDGNRDSDLEDGASEAALDRVRPSMQALARGLPGTLIEDVPGNVTLHYRAVPDREGEILAVAARLARQEEAALRLITGKMVVEFLSRRHGKDGAIAAFMAEPPFRGRRPVFVGDDTTDEDGFAEINRRDGISIKVGAADAPTIAHYRLADVGEVLAWLDAAGAE